MDECHHEVMALSRTQQQEAADGLRRLLEAVQRGDLTVDGPAANALLRRLEGALLALEAVLETSTDWRAYTSNVRLMYTALWTVLRRPLAGLVRSAI